MVRYSIGANETVQYLYKTVYGTLLHYYLIGQVFSHFSVFFASFCNILATRSIKVHITVNSTLLHFYLRHFVVNSHV